MTLRLKAALRNSELTAVAALAGVQIATVKAYIAAARPQRQTTVAAIERALRKLGFVELRKKPDGRTLPLPFEKEVDR